MLATSTLLKLNALCRPWDPRGRSPTAGAEHLDPRVDRAARQGRVMTASLALTGAGTPHPRPIDIE